MKFTHKQQNKVTTPRMSKMRILRIGSKSKEIITTPRMSKMRILRIGLRSKEIITTPRMSKMTIQITTSKMSSSMQRTLSKGNTTMPSKTMTLMILMTFIIKSKKLMTIKLFYTICQKNGSKPKLTTRSAKLLVMRFGTSPRRGSINCLQLKKCKE